MSARSTAYRAPARLKRADGESRQVGFELEFSGLSLDDAARCVQAALGGEIVEPSVALRQVRDADGRDFTVTVDWAFLNRKASAHADDPEYQSWLQGLSDTAALVVPIEIVCPPLPIDQLARLDGLVTGLREAGATGTRESIVAAYGMHINVEPPDLGAETLHTYLKAFSLLQWWLEQAHRVDPSRSLSPYIALYPEKYIEALLEASQPDLDTLIDGYLEHNASRNRALDLLPLLAEFDAERIQAAVDDERIKSRPALHYRLPNCEFDTSDRTLHGPWNIWCTVEALTERPELLDELGRDYLNRRRPLIGIDTTAWKEHTDAWLKDHELV